MTRKKVEEIISFISDYEPDFEITFGIGNTKLVLHSEGTFEFDNETLTYQHLERFVCIDYKYIQYIDF